MPECRRGRVGAVTDEQLRAWTEGQGDAGAAVLQMLDERDAAVCEVHALRRAMGLPAGEVPGAIVGEAMERAAAKASATLDEVAEAARVRAMNLPADTSQSAATRSEFAAAAARELLALEFEERGERYDRLAKEAKAEALEATNEEARREHERRVARFDAIAGAYKEAARVARRPGP